MTDLIRAQAETELAAEQLRQDIDREKARIRARSEAPWWARLFPFVITITRKKP